MQCDYCSKDFVKEWNFQRYCGKRCANRMHKIKKILNQKKRTNTLNPRRCKGCGNEFKMHNMRKYCASCKEIRGS